MVWYGLVLYDMVRYDTVRHGTVWHGTARYGMVRYGMGVNHGVRIGKADHIFCCYWLCFGPADILMMFGLETEGKLAKLCREGFLFLPCNN